MTEAGAMFSDGKVYERMMGRWSKLVGRVFLEWLNAPKNLKWIEVGCGNGAFTEELIAHCAPLEVTAVDPSEGQLSFARTRQANRVNLKRSRSRPYNTDKPHFKNAIPSR
jgi:ubiquinone/menaquinone biosynthesis C-methylase UbiE